VTEPEEIHRQIAEAEDEESGGGEQRRLAHDEIDAARQRPRNVHDPALRAEGGSSIFAETLQAFFEKHEIRLATTIRIADGPTVGLSRRLSKYHSRILKF
jgi:hypothetical protein